MKRWLRGIVAYLLTCLLGATLAYSSVPCTNATQNQCVNGCYWDAWITYGTNEHCFNSLADALASLGSAYIGCDYWNVHDQGNSTACTQHGCQFLSSTSRCVDFSSIYAGNQTSTTVLWSNNAVSWVNPVYTGTGTSISLKARIPWSQRVSATPGHTRVFYVGSPVNDLTTLPSGCMSSYNPAYRPSASAIQSPATQASIDFDLAYWVDTYHSVQFNGNETDYQGTPIASFSGPSNVSGFVINNATLNNQTFDSSNAARTALWSAFGPTMVNSLNSTLIKRVDRVAPAMQNMDYTLQFNMADVAPGGVYSCPGVTTVVSGQVTTYNIPLSAAIIDSFGGATTSSYTLSVAHDIQTGSVTFTPNSRYPVAYTIDNVHAEHGASCPADGTGANGVYWAQAVIRITGTYSDVPSSKVIGPRNASDIILPDSPFAHTLDPSTTYATCSNVTNTCWFSVVMRTECRILDRSGNTFVDNAFMNASRPNIYTSDQATQHTFRVNVYSCDTSHQCTQINIATDGSPDVVVSYIQFQAYPPSMMARERYDISVGILPFPQQMIVPSDNLMSFLPRPVDAYTPSSPIYYKNNTRNQALTFDGMLIPLVWIPPSQWNTSAVIQIDPTSISFVPTTTTGDLVGPAKNWGALKPLMRYIPLAAASTPVEKLPIVLSANSQGVDGFGVPLDLLASAWAQVGIYFQGIQISFSYAITSVPYGSQTATRRLFSLLIDASNTSYLVHGTGMSVSFDMSSADYLNHSSSNVIEASLSRSEQIIVYCAIAIISLSFLVCLFVLVRRWRHRKEHPFCPRAFSTFPYKRVFRV